MDENTPSSGRSIRTKIGVPGRSTPVSQMDAEQRDRLSLGSAPSKHWRVVLGELVHLIGLFISHTKNSEGARAADLLLDQVVRQLGFLSKMPDHEDGILIRRTHCKAPVSPMDAGYSVFFGNLMVSAVDDASSVKQAPHLKSALSQAFQCFVEQGFYSLYIQVPGDDPRKIDQLRLAMNIIARFRSAVHDATSIRFRCYGRALTFSVINDIHGKPDANLTLTAALNGLSPVNTRELVKQAFAFHKMKISGSGEGEASEPVSSYNQIFAVRSLRPQITKPPIEINNLPWLQVDTACARIDTCRPGAILDDIQSERAPEAALDTTVEAFQRPSDLEVTPKQCRQLIAPYIDADDEKNSNSINALVSDDYGALEPLEIGERLILVTRLLHALEKSCQDPTVIDRIIDLFQRRLKRVREDVLSNIIAKRRSLKIMTEGRAVVVGMVHSRLFDVITLVTEHVAAGRRMVIIKAIAFNFDPCHTKSLADGFGISDSDALHILRILDGCFNAKGHFIRPTFEGRIGVMAQYENVIFEILWCFLKETQHRQDRLNFLNALQLLMVRLQNPKRAAQFLLADICQNPAEVAFTDRNAFSLANILLHQENKELYVDMNRTPESVLNIQRRINKAVRKYLFWRLDVDQVRITSKLKTIHLLLLDALDRPSGERKPFDVHFLMALEREAIIFLAIVGGHTARSYLRELLDRYGTPDADLYRLAAQSKSLSELMAQLQIVIRALGRAGNMEDVTRLAALREKEDGFCRLVSHPAHTVRTRQTLKWIPVAMKMIQAKA